MKKVALISPAPEYMKPLAEHRGPFARLRRLPRLSLSALAAVTPPDWDLRLYDERVEAFDPDRIDAEIVGITTMTYMAPRAFEMARALKARGKKVVLGGYFPTLSPDLALAEPAVDAVVIGRGERAWPRLLLDQSRGKLERIYDLPFGEDGFRLPPVDHRRSAPSLGFNGWITQVQATLGCKFRCKFCVIPQFHGAKVSLRDLHDITEEVARAPTRRVLFVDDNLLNRPAYLDALCDRLRPLGKEWIAQVSMDIAKQPKLIKKMAKSGCGWLNVGIESVNAGTLAAQEKWQNDTRHYLEALAMIRDHGISLSAGMVLGFPDEPKDVFDLTGEFLDRAPIDITVFHLYTPYPGTAEHAAFEDEGRILTRDLSLYDTYHVVVRPRHFAPEEVAMRFEALQERFYGLRNVASRALGSLSRAGVLGFLRTMATGAEGLINLREGIPLHP
ncbi:MAG: radical SAM protein [Myxococcota bacterium]